MYTQLIDEEGSFYAYYYKAHLLIYHLSTDPTVLVISAHFNK